MAAESPRCLHSFARRRCAQLCPARGTMEAGTDQETEADASRSGVRRREGELELDHGGRGEERTRRPRHPPWCVLLRRLLRSTPVAVRLHRARGQPSSLDEIEGERAQRAAAACYERRRGGEEPGTRRRRGLGLGFHRRRDSSHAGRRELTAVAAFQRRPRTPSGPVVMHP
jgi:hypothetical protein